MLKKFWLLILTQLIGENYSRYERSNFWRTLWVFTVSRTSKGGRRGGTNCADIPDSRDKVGVTLKASPPFQPSHFKDDIGGQESLLRRSCGLRCLIRKSLARPTGDTFCPKLASLPPFRYSLDRDTYEKILKKLSLSGSDESRIFSSVNFPRIRHTVFGKRSL